MYQKIQLSQAIPREKLERYKIMEKKKDTNCLFCGNTSFRTLIATENLGILVCNQCKIAKTHPAPELPDYEEMDFHAHTAVEDLVTIESLPKDWQKSIRTEVEMVKNNVPAGSNVLEIGCGDGLLINELQKSDFNCFGIEPSHTATKRAVNKGLNVIQGYFPKTSFDCKMDVVILTHVFEHIENPIDFIEAVKAILNPGGYMLFAQTNYLGLIPKLQKENWYAWVPQHHYWHFTLQGLSSFMTAQSFELSTKEYVSLVHPDNFRYKLSKVIPKLADQFIALYKKI